ncbi:MAG: Cna B-type domain-containing protein, partial [Clostridiales bacterium]|nr:Cna B-type domain-containing protein [Clostridiales bacterium]
MKKTTSLVSIALFLFMIFSVCGVHSETMGSLTIKYMSKDTGKGISGVEMSLFRVGDISGGIYELNPDFGEAAVDLNSITTDSSKYNAARTLYMYSVQHSISGTVLYTDVSGNAYFPGLLPGVFVVAQTKAVSGFKTISPYIVFIPERGVGGTPIYDVLSNVKTEKENTGTGGSGGNGGGGSGGGVGDISFSVTVAKIWDDSDNADGIRPQSVSVTLLRNGKKLTTASLSSENGWKHTFLKLSGNKSSYTVEETPVDGYTASYSGSASEGFVIVNSHSAVNPPKTEDMSVFVRKQWV